MKGKLINLGLLTCVVWINAPVKVSVALPPSEDIPEEILRSEIITEARSPIDGQPLSSAEYAQLQAEIAESPYAPQLSPKLRDLIFLLQLRKLLKTILPF